MAALTDRIIGAESGGDPFARNPRSSAGGKYQFIDSTWLETLRKHRPDLVQGKTREELLALKMGNSPLVDEMGQAHTMDNQAFLKARGIEPNDVNAYLAHFAGPAGAAAIHANPGATVESLLGARAVAANPFLKGKTGADVIAFAGRKMSPGQQMAKSLRQRYGSEGASAAPTPAAADGATAMAPGGLDKLKAALGGKKYDSDWHATSEKLMADGQQIGANAKNGLGAIGGTLLAGFGGYMTGQEQANKKADEKSTIAALGGGSAPPAVKALLESSDPDHRAAGIDAMLKLATAKPNNEWTPTADGTLVVNKATGEAKPTGASRRDQNAPADVKTYEFDMEQREAAGEARVPFHEWVKTHKPGSSDLGSELGARIGVADLFQGKVQSIKDRISQMDGLDRINLAVGRGNAQKIWRDIEDGREAYIRLQTGAGMSESEAKNAIARFQIQSDDQTGTMLEKVQGLSEVLSAARQGAIEAKTGATARKFTADNDPAKIALKKQAEAELAKRGALTPPAAPAGPPLAAPVGGPPLASRVPPGAVPPPAAQPGGQPAPVPGAPPPAAAAPAIAPAIAEQQIDPATGAPLESTEPQVPPPLAQPAGNAALKALSLEELRRIARGGQ